MLRIVFVLLFCVFSVRCKDDVENCRHEATNSPGLCKSILDCNFAKEELQNGRRPQLCGFKTAQPIICCPEEPKKSLPVQLAKNRGVDVCRKKYFGIELGGNLYAAKTEFPHRALIGYEDSTGNVTYLCLGTVISERFVLTAAHCFFSRTSGSPTSVKVGESQVFKVKRLISHPDFKQPEIYNDIGLIELNEDVVFDDKVKPACLESVTANLTDQRVSTLAWPSRYVNLDPHSFVDDRSRELEKMDLWVTSREQCSKHYSAMRRLSMGILDELQVCAGFRGKAYDCRGESGGALQVYSEDVLTVVGVTSINRCFDVEASGVFTRVSHYIDWIRAVVDGKSNL